MKTTATIAALMLLATPGFAQLGRTTSPSMPGRSTTNPSDPSRPLGSPPIGSPLSDAPSNPLGRTPSSTPSVNGPDLDRSRTTGTRAPATDAGRPAGAPLGTGDGNPATPN